MFSEATYPHSEQTVSPLMSSESQEVLPQTSHDPSTASTLLVLEGLGPVARGHFVLGFGFRLKRVFGFVILGPEVCLFVFLLFLTLFPRFFLAYLLALLPSPRST